MLILLSFSVQKVNSLKRPLPPRRPYRPYFLQKNAADRYLKYVDLIFPFRKSITRSSSLHQKSRIKYLNKSDSLIRASRTQEYPPSNPMFRILSGLILTIISPPIMLMCHKVILRNLIDSSPLFRNS